MKKTTDWQWWFKPLHKRYNYIDMIGWHLFDVGIIKLHTLPDEGAMVGKEHYYGFIIRFMWWFPIDRA